MPGCSRPTESISTWRVRNMPSPGSRKARCVFKARSSASTRSFGRTVYGRTRPAPRIRPCFSGRPNVPWTRARTLRCAPRHSTRGSRSKRQRAESRKSGAGVARAQSGCSRRTARPRSRPGGATRPEDGRPVDAFAVALQWSAETRRWLRAGAACDGRCRIVDHREPECPPPRPPGLQGLAAPATLPPLPLYPLTDAVAKSIGERLANLT